MDAKTIVAVVLVAFIIGGGAIRPLLLSKEVKMNQLEKFEDRVLSVLESNTQSRSDDMVLYLLVCNSYSNNENPIGKMPFEVVMKHYRELKLPHFESVRRTRQKIQATHPELGCLPEYRRNRKKMQKLYTDYARK